MKKTIILLLTVLLIMVSCNKTTYEDGVYSADFQTYDSIGYKGFLEIIMESDEITEAVFDYTDAEDNLKSKDSAYNAAMFNSEGITKPETFCPQIEAIIANAKILPEFTGFDAVTGATLSSNDAELLLEALLSSARQGEPNHISIPPPTE